MAKQLWFRGDATLAADIAKVHRGNNDAKLNGTAAWWNPFALAETRGSNASGGFFYTANTITGPTNGVEIDNKGAVPFEWLSEPLSADFTIAGTITFNIWVLENSMSANVAINAVVEKLDGATGTLTQIAKTARTTEESTTVAAANFTVTPTSTACKRSDRLRIRIFADDAGTMATGFTVQVQLSASGAGATGDTWVQFTENLTFEPAGDPTGSTYYLTDTDSDLTNTYLEEPFGDSPIPVGLATNPARYAHSFPAAGTSLTEVVVQLSKTGVPGDDLVIEIQTDSAGTPSGTVVGTVATVVQSSLTTSLVAYTYACSISLTAGATYWIVFRRSAGLINGANYYSVNTVTTGTIKNVQFGWAKLYDSAGSSWGVATLRQITARLKFTATVESAKTTRGSGSVNAVTNTVTGPTLGTPITRSAGGAPIEWYTPPLNAFTLGGKAKFNIRALESNAAANASLCAQVAVVNGDGTGAVIWGTSNIESDASGGELGTTDAAKFAWVAGDDLAVTAGQRLRFRVFVEDVAIGPLVTGYTVTTSFNGATASAAGDTYVILPQAVTEQILTTPISGTDANGAVTESAIVNQSFASADSGTISETIGSRTLAEVDTGTEIETLGNRTLAVTDSNVSVIGAIPPFSGNTFGIGSFASNAKIAQSFRFGSDFTIGSLLLYLVRFGTTVDNSIFEIQTDNAGSPSGTVLGTYTVASSAIPSSAAWIQMVGTIPGLSLTANTTYWIVASRSGAIDSGKDVEWVFTSPSVYADGSKAAWNGSFWTPDSTSDVGFQLTPSMESAVASQPVSKSGSDSNGATTETQTEVAIYSATDTSGTITESTSIVSVTPISATDTNGVTIEVVTPKAVPAVADTSGVVSETLALVSAFAVPDINGVVTEATPLLARPTTTDSNGAVTETTGIVQVNPVSATDSNSTTTETGVPKAVPAVTDVNSATTEAIGNTAKATLDINSTVIESASLSTVNQISGTDTNGATTENITQVASATTTDSGTGTDTQSVDQGALPKASSDTNSTTTEVAGVTKAPLPISGLALWFDASQLSLAGGATLKDDYNRTNASTLGANWAQVTSIGSNRLAVNGNEAKASGSTYADAWTPQTYGSDQEVTLTLKTIDYSAPHTWLLLQMPDPAMGSFTGYLLDIVTGFDHYVLTLYRGNAGSYTNLFSVDPISYGHGGTGVGDVWTIRKVGALITVLLNGSPVAGFPITDPAPLTATTTYVGTGGSGSSNSTFDDFMAGVPGAGTAVTEWPNLSNPSLPGPMVGTPVPQLRANALNSMPVVRFAANEGRLRMNGTSGLGTDYTLVYVGRIWGATNGRVVNGIYPPANILFGWWTSYQDVAYAEGFTTPDVKVPFTNDWKMYSADGVSGLQRFLSDGTLLGSTTTGTGWQNTFGISGYSPTGLEETADCEVAEVLVYNRKLSDVERQQVEGYLRTKWFPGVAVSANDNNIGVNESVTQVAAESATDTNSVTVEAVSKIAVIATDANVGVTESVAMARQVADVNGGTTETASNGAPIAATDTNGVTTESIAGRSATLSDVNSVVSESATYIVKTTITDVSSTITETTALVNKTTTGDNNSVVSELVSLRLAASDINGTTTEFAKTSRLVFDSSSPTADFATVTLIQLTDGDYGTATESASLFKQFIGGTFTVGRGRIIRRSSGKVTLNDKGRVPTSEAYGKVNLDDEGRMQRETTGRAS